MGHDELIIFRQTSSQCHALRVLAIALVRLIRPWEEEPGDLTASTYTAAGNFCQNSFRADNLHAARFFLLMDRIALRRARIRTCKGLATFISLPSDNTTACSDADKGAASGRRAPILRPVSAPNHNPPSGHPTHPAERAPLSSARHEHDDTRGRAGTPAGGPLSVP